MCSTSTVDEASSLNKPGLKKHGIMLEDSVIRFADNLASRRKDKSGMPWSRQVVIREAIAIGLAEMARKR